MESTIVVNVTTDKQLNLPVNIQEQLTPGDTYLFWQTDDTFIFKKIQKPRPYSDLFAKIERLGADQNPPPIDEICDIVKEIRQQSQP